MQCGLGAKEQDQAGAARLEAKKFTPNKMTCLQRTEKRSKAMRSRNTWTKLGFGERGNKLPHGQKTGGAEPYHTGRQGERKISMQKKSEMDLRPIAVADWPCDQKSQQKGTAQAEAESKHMCRVSKSKAWSEEITSTLSRKDELTIMRKGYRNGATAYRGWEKSNGSKINRGDSETLMWEIRIGGPDSKSQPVFKNLVEPRKLDVTDPVGFWKIQ
jgi:hypothetical protein